MTDTNKPRWCRPFGATALLLLSSIVPTSGQEPPPTEPLAVSWQVTGIDGPLLANALAASAGLRAATTPSDAELTVLAGRVARAMEAALQPLGYYEADAAASISGEGSARAVRFEVAAGRPVRVTRSDVRLIGAGSTDPFFTEARDQGRMVPGSILSHESHEDLKAQLAAVAADRGYLDARLDSSLIRVDRTRRTAEVVLHFVSGPRYRLGPARFEQDLIHPGILADLVPWRVGDPYNSAHFVNLFNALVQGPYFENAQIVPRRDLAENNHVPIDVRLVPAPSQRYSVGAGYASDTGPRGTFVAEARRLNRGGHRAELDLRAAAVELRAAARYQIPIRARRGSLLTLSAGYSDLHPETSDTETWLVGANLAGVLWGWRTDVGLTLQRAWYDVGSQSGVTNLLLAGVGGSRVRADDRLAPESGSLLRVRGRAGVAGVLSDVSLREIALEARFIYSPTRRLRLRTRGELGILHTPDFNRLPGSIRYFTGGDASVRGFEYRALGPRDGSGEIIGGSRLLVVSGEAEWRFTPSLGGAVFLDAGNAFSSLSDGLERGAGLGVRWLSPIGMIRLDGAFAISRSGNPFRVHLGVGPEL